MTDTITEIMERADELADKYSVDLDAFVNGLVPTFLDNKEYAARTAALMIALSREIARCASSFGETHQIDRREMIGMVGQMFGSHYGRCIAAIDEGAGKLVH